MRPVASLTILLGASLALAGCSKPAPSSAAASAATAAPAAPAAPAQAATPAAPANAAQTTTWMVSATFTEHGRLVGTATPVCSFQQAGELISGTCKGPNGIGPAAGTIRGGAVEWQWDHRATTAMGVTGATRFRGTVGADGVVRGSAASSNLPGATGAFTAMKQ